MELQNDFEEPVGERRTHDDNSNGVLLVPQPDRPTMRQCFLYFVPRDSMLFPYFPFNEGFNVEIFKHLNRGNSTQSTSSPMSSTFASLPWEA